MFRVVAVSGSPREGGNTEALVDAAAEPFAAAGHRVEKFYLSREEVGPCLACDACELDHTCVIEDDWQELWPKVAACGALLVGSPVYNRNVSAQLQPAFNRFHCVLHTHPFRDRICFGGAIAVGNAPNSQGTVLNVIYSFLLSLGIYCVPAVLNGVSAVARERGEVLKQPQSLAAARALGENILRALVRTRGEE
ncbi:MAG: flavodoxin family protein [Deltaproteobacteria bacterium]|nr:flavodoxin family protein [Deltaproteobacteria bacterium]